MKAALQAKQKKDLEQAKGFLRSAKALDPLIEAARAGNPVDISKVSPTSSMGLYCSEWPSWLLIANRQPGDAKLQIRTA